MNLSLSGVFDSATTVSVGLVISNVATSRHNNNRCRPRPPPATTTGTGNTTKGIKALTRSILFNGVNTMLAPMFHIQYSMLAFCWNFNSLQASEKFLWS